MQLYQLTFLLFGAGNDFFVKATGLRKNDIERMTIFSLVKPEKLSNFFGIVASALRTNEDEEQENSNDAASTNSVKDTAASSSANEEVKSVDNQENQYDYAAITLPCVDFPAMKKRREAAEPSRHSDPLYVTVTLMGDEDPRKRCFHCVLTDCPGTKGALGSITPELLSSLFTTPASRHKKSKHRKHKRACSGRDSQYINEKDEKEDVRNESDDKPGLHETKPNSERTDIFDN